MRKSERANELRTRWRPSLLLASLLNTLAIACIQLEVRVLHPSGGSLTNSTKPTLPSSEPKATSVRSGGSGKENRGTTTGSDGDGAGDH